MASGQAYVTLATNDSYGLGALVLGHSLRNSATTRKLVILITPEVSSSMRNQLNKVFDVVEIVDVLDSNDSANLTLLARPELGVTLTKLHAWNLTQFSKAVFLDADALVLSNVDELFDREELSAVPDVGWPDCFNTGVFVFKPSSDTYNALLKFAANTGSFDGGDQGLLNTFFSSWATDDIKKHLSFIYNMVATAIYSYAPAFKQYGGKVKIVHFLGNTKPWHHTSGVAGGFSPALGNYLAQWWGIFNSQVRTALEPGLVGLAGRIGQLDLGSHYEQRVSSSHGGGRESQRRDWESGNIDYMGSDKFENIQKRIQESIHKSEVGQPSRKSPPPAGRPVEDAPTMMEKAKDAVSAASEPVIAAASSAVHAASVASDAVSSAVGAGLVHAVEGAASAMHAASDAAGAVTSAVGAGLSHAADGAASAVHAAQSATQAVGASVGAGISHAVEGAASLGQAAVDKVTGLFHATPEADEKNLQSGATRPSPPPGASTPGHVVSTVTIEPSRPVQPVQPMVHESSRVESTTSQGSRPVQAGGSVTVESHVKTTTQETRKSPPVQGGASTTVQETRQVTAPAHAATSHGTRQVTPPVQGAAPTAAQGARQVTPPVQGAQGLRQPTPPVTGVPPQQQQQHAPKK